jgi:hypothetical protein
VRERESEASVCLVHKEREGERGKEKENAREIPSLQRHKLLSLQAFKEARFVYGFAV